MEALINIKDAYNFGKNYLCAADIKDAEISADELLRFLTKGLPVKYFFNNDRQLSQKELIHYKDLLKRRSNNEPLQYITGKAYFWEETIFVEPGVLIPRPETEMLVEYVIDVLNDMNKPEYLIADLCTGSGCISIALLEKFENSQIYATDISDVALNCAKKNVEEYGLWQNLSLLKGNLGDPILKNYPHLMGKFDLVVANPPYVPSGIIDMLEPEVADFEPRLALDGGEDGLKFVPDIFRFANKALRSGGCLALELHEDCKDKIPDIAKNCGFPNGYINKDLNGKYRFVIAQKKRP